MKIRKCLNCGCDISKKHINAKFCNNKGIGNCKDAFNNQLDDRKGRRYSSEYKQWTSDTEENYWDEMSSREAVQGE